MDRVVLNRENGTWCAQIGGIRAYANERENALARVAEIAYARLKEARDSVAAATVGVA